MEPSSALGSPAPDELVFSYAVIEGLFVHGLKVTPESELGRALLDIGVDLAHPQHRYAHRTWVQCIELACRLRYRGLPRDVALRHLGRLAVEGYLQTMGGKALAMIVPRLTAARIVEQMPSFIGLGRPGIGTRPVHVSERHARLEVRRSPQAVPSYVAGMFDACLIAAKVKAELKITPLAPGSYDIDLIW